MPCPYNIIFGRDTAMPSPLYYSGALASLRYLCNIFAIFVVVLTTPPKNLS